MHAQIYVNLPVKDLPRARSFFEKLGYGFNPQFSNELGACLVLGENIFVMLLVESFFQTFTKKPLADARNSTEVLLCVSCNSRGQVDALVAKALGAGATAPNAPQDHSFMYSHGFEDLDGHVWELVHMSGEAPAP